MKYLLRRHIKYIFIRISIVRVHSILERISTLMGLEIMTGILIKVYPLSDSQNISHREGHNGLYGNTTFF